MNREIKFRAWDKKNRQMSTPFTINKLTQYEHIFETMFPILPSFADLIWLEYTGLKDKNETEIYEGDIARYKQKPPHKQTAIDYYSTIIFKDSCFTLDPNFIRWNDLALGFMSCHIEVIGNIYENKELLEC